ncbi:MAG: heavy metal-binding domain-containing protein [candidate division Zixibacteria bacterium]|nr:heavy metal-binding domain-containing protein [candidate division Zixibacteria bacterium]
MLILTTPTIEGKTIVKYHGLVSGQAIMGANLFKDLFARVRDVVGGRSASYEQELRRAKDLAMKEMADECTSLGGNAIVGVDLDFETIGESMLMVSASGTAVSCQ